jgi:CheY-like chemotaxis protein
MESLIIEDFMESSTAKILVVDDSTTNRELVCQILSFEGYLTEEASNGSEAIEMLNHERFDLVISDIEMPVMNGIEMAREMRLSKLPSVSSLPFILMSGNAASYIKEIEALANYFLPKPFRIEDLLSTVKKALGE